MKNHHSFKVFIVEDDVWYGSMLQHYLSLNPEYEVKRFESPHNFFAALHENPDVVTLDYSLPDFSNLKQEVETLKSQVGRKYDFSQMIIGKSDAIEKVFSLIEKAAKTNI